MWGLFCLFVFWGGRTVSIIWKQTGKENSEPWHRNINHTEDFWGKAVNIKKDYIWNSPTVTSHPAPLWCKEAAPKQSQNHADKLEPFTQQLKELRNKEIETKWKYYVKVVDIQSINKYQEEKTYLNIIKRRCSWKGKLTEFQANFLVSNKPLREPMKSSLPWDF